MSFHSATISTIFKGYKSFLMLQSSLLNDNTANKITNFIGFMKLACGFGQSKEKLVLYASFHHQEYCQYQKKLLKFKGTTST